MFSITKILCVLVLSLAAYTASADQSAQSHARPNGLQWRYAGQISAPENGSPPAWHPGVNYCGTEYPQNCYNYGERCYTNNGYWWDNGNQCNWFNYYECRW